MKLKLYLDIMGVMLKSKGLAPRLNEMLAEVWLLAGDAENNQRVILNPYHKDLVCEKTGKSRRYLDYAIKTWVEHDIMERIAKDTYLLNPHVFGEGRLADISKSAIVIDFMSGKGTFSKEYEMAGDEDGRKE